MQLATALVGDATAFGPIVDGELCDVSGSGRWPTLADALGTDQSEALATISRSAPRIPLGDVVLLPPVPSPRRILCVGLNYRDHAAESDQTATAYQEFPVIFTRFASSIVGAGEPIVCPTASTSFDYEGELAVVIGERVRSISRSQAHDAIAGYSCFMDGTLRDFQRHTSQFIPGKNFDRSGSFGPWITTRDDCDLDSMVLSTLVNGETVQFAAISDMVHPIADLIAYCSSFTTLEPGDVIATGTPGGVGYARNPQRWLNHGDVVDVEISGIGVLSNRVISESAEPATTSCRW